MMMERSFLLFIISAVLNCILIVCLIFTCVGKRGDSSEVTETSESIIEIPEEITQEEPEQEIEQTETAAAAAPGVSYTPSRSSSGIRDIRGRVNSSEVNPINLQNPDINVLVQMGAEQYLIHFFTGEQLYKSNDYDRAITEYNAAVNLNPAFTEAFISRGNCWIKKNDFNRAIEDFNRALRLDTNRAEIYNYRGFARMEQAARSGQTGSSREYAQAIEDFTRALAINRNYVDALINRSYAYFQTGNYDNVIEDCTRIINLEPGNAFIWNRRGSAYYFKEDDDRAINDFTEAIRLRADYAVAYRNRGNAWQSKGDLEKANSDFAAAQRLSR